MRAAVAVWYPAPFHRRRLDDLDDVKQAKVGQTRQAVAAQLRAHRHEVDTVIAQLQKHRKTTARRLQRHHGQHEHVKTTASVVDRSSKLFRASSAPPAVSVDAGGVAEPSAGSQADASQAARPVDISTKVDILSDLPDSARDCMSPAELHDLMVTLNRGRPVSTWAVSYVLNLADVSADESAIQPSAVADALAAWHCLRQHQDAIESYFDEFDTNHNGLLDKSDVRRLLTTLNDGIQVSWAETEWAIESADVDGSGSLSREELRAAVAWWYLRVSRPKIVLQVGCRALLPWCLAVLVGLLCSAFVAAVSVLWDADQTIAWVKVTLLSLLLKIVCMDVLKALCCGPLLTPILSFLTCDVCPAHTPLIMTVSVL